MTNVSPNKIIEVLRRIVEILREEGYDPIVVGTYALVLQDWLPESYVAITKDIDLYVASADILVDILELSEKLVKKFESAGFSVVVHETGGIEVASTELDKPVEILYPLGDIFVPNALLREVVHIAGLKVLEAHAVIVAKALGDESSLMRVADVVKQRGIRVDADRLRMLAESVARELREYGEAGLAAKLLRRVDMFLRRVQAKDTRRYSWGVVEA